MQIVKAYQVFRFKQHTEVFTELRITRFVPELVATYLDCKVALNHAQKITDSEINAINASNTPLEEYTEWEGDTCCTWYVKNQDWNPVARFTSINITN